ncbi:YbaB/EbfC family nucleoid-associated protein [Hoeflea sp. TYP-13]|uniref:YbaB/EbfC family nucleoid-associated protein n=1 Tax=Hoeflea sp. TYP-13 TaxID=3230023 RepID=UPI0034C65AF7
MRDLMGMMGKVKEMQEKMASMQEEVEKLELEGTSGGGMVTVRLNGKGIMLGLSVDPSLINSDEVEILEDLIVAAHNDAKGKVEAAVQEKTQELTAGLPIPPGMKLPF